MLIPRRIKLSFLVVLFFVFISGCSGTPYETFQQAMEQTDEISKGKSKFSLDLNLEFKESSDTESLKPLDLEKLEVQHQFDKTRSLSQSTIFTKVNEFGFDLKIYQDGSQFYMVSPLFPKIFILNEQQFSDEGHAQYDKPFLTEETVKQLNKLWGSILTDENVTQLGTIILTTPDGDVKATEYQLNLTSDILSPVLLKTIDILSGDPVLNEQIEQGFNQYRPDSHQSISAQEIWQFNRNWIENATIGPVSYLAYIDRDGYIIEEKLDVQIEGGSEGASVGTDQLKMVPIKSVAFTFHLQRWDIEKDVDIQLPQVTEENSMTFERFEEDNPFIDFIPGKGAQSQ